MRSKPSLIVNHILLLNSLVGSCCSLSPMFNNALMNASCGVNLAAPQWHSVRRPTRSLINPVELWWHTHPLSKAWPVDMSGICSCETVDDAHDGVMVAMDAFVSMGERSSVLKLSGDVAMWWMAKTVNNDNEWIGIKVMCYYFYYQML